MEKNEAIDMVPSVDERRALFEEDMVFSFGVGLRDYLRAEWNGSSFRNGNFQSMWTLWNIGKYGRITV